MEKGLLGFIQSVFGLKKNVGDCGKKCTDCIAILCKVIDKEATEEELKHFNEHICECTGCYKHYELHKAVKEVVQLKIEKKEVPCDLIKNIKSKLNQAHGG